MGNTPTKEARPRAYSHGIGGSGYENDYRARRNTTSMFNEYKKLKKQEEKEKQLEAHYKGLVVRYNETVDGGFLAPYGTYKLNLDFNVQIVKDLIINRKLAPFYTPLQDYDDSWTDEELLIIVKQLPLHSIDTAYSDLEEEDDIDNHKIHKSSNFFKRQEQKQRLKELVETVKQMQKNEELKYLEIKQDGEDKVLPSDDFLLRLYRHPEECPICFLYYPDNLNLSRCCLQPICTECFVQIKRLDPHAPHDDTSKSDELPHTLISEPANCPYCAMTDFGVLFEKKLNILTGVKGILPSEYKESVPEEVISSSPESSSEAVFKTRKHRRSSIPANSPKVITIDQIRPDWEAKLNSAKNKLARKSAAASAIHASNLIINPENDMAEYDTRNRRRGNSSVTTSGVQLVEDRMLEEAMRLSIIDEEERVRRENSK